MKLLSLSLLYFICTATLSAQEIQYNHQLQIGLYLGQAGGPGIGSHYSYRFNDYVAGIGGVLVYRYTPWQQFMYGNSEYPTDRPAWAQVHFTTPVNDVGLGEDSYDIGMPASYTSGGNDEFYFEPELGIQFTTPSIIKDIFEFSLAFTLRLDIWSIAFLTHEGHAHWFDEEGNYIDFHGYFVNYYERGVGPFGFNFHPSLKVNISSTAFAGVHLYLHSLSNRNLGTAFLDTFRSPYGSIGVILGTKF